MTVSSLRISRQRIRVRPALVITSLFSHGKSAVVDNGERATRRAGNAVETQLSATMGVTAVCVALV